MQLGFVGLGKMGLNMVTRLIGDGHQVVAYDRSAEAIAHAEAAGARGASSLGLAIAAPDRWPARGHRRCARAIPAGYELGSAVPSYRDEPGVTNNSRTETFIALKVFVDNWRWAGVPFFLRTGKRLPKRASEISVHLKDVPPILFNAGDAGPLDPNVLAIPIQPDEGFALAINLEDSGASGAHLLRVGGQRGSTRRQILGSGG